MKLHIFGLITLLFGFHQALIVPQELPSILSLIYSNIPPIKKGTDSRLGFGFRLGEHADFQVMLELGPQTQTRKIGGVNANKREVNSKDSLTPDSENAKTYKEASGWLTQWSKDMKKSKKKEFAKGPKRSTTSTTSTTVRTVPLISEDSLKHLQQLYKANNSE